MTQPRSSQSAPALGESLHGFHIDSITPVPDLRARAVRATHLTSGAQVLHVHVPEDSENGFALAFPTPPSDDTGLPHILEHAVLAGSQKYPLREPFFEMLKLSPASFINAITFPDLTIYPACSTVAADFYNLFDVYLDAVFHPLITEETFRREGHHLRLEDTADPASPLKIGGIVYNEMKGASVYPERTISCAVLPELLADTPSGFDTGGDPRRIPELTFEHLREFYRRHYHTGNARVFFYGNLPTGEHLRRLGVALDRLPAGEPTPCIKGQPRWSEPRRKEARYAIASGESPKGRTYLNLSWIFGDSSDARAMADGKILSAILLENDAAPLKAALIASKLGADLMDSMRGITEFRPDAIFKLTLRGSEPDRAEAFEKLVMETLAELAAKPFPPDMVESAINQVSHAQLEVGREHVMEMIYRVIPVWMNDADPLPFLSPRAALEEARARYTADPMALSEIIRARLLENPHRLLTVLVPDPDMQAREEAELKEQLARRRAAMSEAEIAEIARKAAALDAAQDTPNPPEAIALLPQIRVSDLPASPVDFPCETTRLATVTLLRNEVFSNGINHLEVAIDLAGLPAELYPWLPLYVEAVRKMGCEGENYLATARRRAAFTGELTVEAKARLTAHGDARPVRTLRIGFRMLDHQVDGALALLGDLVFTIDPTDRDRLREVIIQARESLRTELNSDSHTTTALCAGRLHSAAAALSCLFRGPETLQCFHDLAEHFEERAGEATRALLRIRGHLAAGTKWTASFTGGDAAFRSLSRAIETWRPHALPESADDPLPESLLSGTVVRDGWAAATSVADCCKAIAAPPLDAPEGSLLRVGYHLLKYDHLLPQIRLKGNAYGAFVAYNDALGFIAQSSYRDPNIHPTLHTFDGARGFIAAQNWTKTQTDRAIIGVAKDAVAPIRPGPATAQSLERHLRGITPDLRQRQHESLLAATPEKVKEAMLRHLESGEARAGICVLASREKLEEANPTLPPNRTLAIRNLIPE